MTKPTYDLCLLALQRLNWFTGDPQVCPECVLTAAKGALRSVDDNLEKVEKLLNETP